MYFRGRLFHHKHCAKNAKLNMENVWHLCLLLRGQKVTRRCLLLRATVGKHPV